MDKYIRQIFSVFALGMIAMLVIRIRSDAWEPVNWIMLAVGAVCCVLVFRVFLYIFNYSYALASIFNGALLAAWFANGPALLLGGAMVLYGVRIFLFSWFRMSSSSYAPRFENVRKADAQMPSPVKFALWLQCTFLYGFHLFAVYLAGQAGEVNASVLFGTIIILAGTVIEGLADQQKQRSKAVAPDDFVQTGLFARWRHPNYMGEILVQVGLIVAGFGVAGIGWSGYMAVVLAPLYIILLMVAEAGRADGYMELRYGERPEFADYRTRSGSLLPRF